MLSPAGFDLDLIRRYDTAAPRYTSYPTALAFNSAFNANQYEQHARASNQGTTIKPLSLYLHVPFCKQICFYCACNKIATNKAAKIEHYLDYLIQEIKLQSTLYDPTRRVEQLHFGGGTPTILSSEQMATLMAHIRQHFNLHNDDNGEYSIEIDPRTVSEDYIHELRALGFNRFSLGFQDFDPNVQAAINRLQPERTNRTILNACRAAQAHSISVDLIYGLPLQTVNSFAQTIDKVIDMAPDRLSVFNYAHMPALFKPQRQIDIHSLPNATTKLAILEMVQQKLTKAGYVHIGMDHFALPQDSLSQALSNNTLKRNFQGYTTHADTDLVAMGISAISHVNQSYSQNHKTLADYYEALDNGKLPVSKGIALHDDDIIRAEVIQAISCEYNVNFSKLKNQFAIDFLIYFEDRLDDLYKMETDGLLKLSEENLTITDKGRYLIRTICMVFDAYMGRAVGEKRYSKAI